MRDIEFGTVLPSRFWKRVTRTGTCWLWTGGKMEGYGAFWRDGRNNGAHVVMYEAMSGEKVPAGMMVCHRCDVRACVRPADLFLGTAADNRADCVAKNRQKGPVGALHGMSKLTEQDVRDIKAARAAGQRIIDIAEQRGVHANTISAVCNGKRWQHVS